MEGAGVYLHRAFGFEETEQFDPFLLLDDFRSSNPDHYLPGFPWHPHRGIETITYILKGEVDHSDSLGNSGTIEDGDVQWMTAGSGIIHQEMPRGARDGAMLGFQLWANLPSSLKMTDPRYRDIKAAKIPEIETETGVRIRVIAGTVNGTTGPMEEIFIQPEYLDITLPPGGIWEHSIPRDHTAFFYVIGGKVKTDNRTLTDRDLGLLGEGDYAEFHAGEKGGRFLLISGKPLKEPVAWRGPIVMNTQEELDRAFREYKDGTFIGQKK